MNKLIILTIASILLCTAPAFCSSTLNKHIDLLQHEIDQLDLETNAKKLKDLSAIISANIAYLEGKIQKKMENTLKKIEKYQTNISEDPEDPDVQKWTDKINSAKEKLTHLNDLLQTIELWKSKIVKDESKECCPS